MLQTYMQAAERGEALWLDELREAFSKSAVAERIVLRLTGCDGAVRDRELWIPHWEDDAEHAFVLEYVSAFLFNLLSCFGGSELRVFLPDNTTKFSGMIDELKEIFALRSAARSGYGKVVSVSNRLNRAFGAAELHFERDELSRYRLIPDEKTEPGRELGERLRALTRSAEDRLCCGIDVGGTDVKAAVSRNGKLLFTKEYDWDPASCTTAEQLIEPLLLIARLLRLAAVCPGEEAPRAAMPREASLTLIRETVTALENENAARLRGFDSIGLSFPDVVIRDRILGGETPKTSGLRRNPELNYETEFAKLNGLRERLLGLCTPEGRVRIANDGSVAAFTAAVEMAAKGEPVTYGVFAHSLGTDLGTGWLNEEGELPPLPLEMYDFLLDLGSCPQGRFVPEDVRSVRNENSGLPDARKYLGQSAAFRLAAQHAPSLLQGFLREEGGVLRIRTSPEDMRKACLEHLMSRAGAGDPAAAEIFRQIGRHLGHISREIDFLLKPKTNRRYLYGRFVKHSACFALLQEGCREVMPELELIAADDSLAASPLMRQLAAMRVTTVAQFGQAVGSIYFGLS